MTSDSPASTRPLGLAQVPVDDIAPEEVLDRIAREIGIDPGRREHWPTGTTGIPGSRPAGEFAAMALWETGRLAAALCGSDAPPAVDTLLASATLGGFAVQRLNGAVVPRLNDTNQFIGLFPCADGTWIQLQGGFPTLRERTARALGVGIDATVEEIAARCLTWDAERLEDAIAAERGCAAAVRSYDQWRVHEHGCRVDALDAVEVGVADDHAADALRWTPTTNRPLSGLRVVDITRVLAGPTAGRTLAMLGADVLHVRGPDVPFIEPYVIDTGHGKRSAFCDFRDAEQVAALRHAVAEAHVVIDGNRPGVLERFGLGVDDLLGTGATRIAVHIDCFGPEGPWAGRAGMEQIAQAACGVAAPDVGRAEPALIKAAAIDYGTGYLGALGVVRALHATLTDGAPRTVHASLCQTATRLAAVGRRPQPYAGDGHRFVEVADRLVATETPMGTLVHLPPPIGIEGLDIGWDRPPVPLGSHPLEF